MRGVTSWLLQVNSGYKRRADTESDTCPNNCCRQLSVPFSYASWGWQETFFKGWNEKNAWVGGKFLGFSEISRAEPLRARRRHFLPINQLTVIICNLSGWSSGVTNLPNHNLITETQTSQHPSCCKNTFVYEAVRKKCEKRNKPRRSWFITSS